MKTEQQVRDQLNIKNEPYTVYWIDTKGNNRKSCILATNEPHAMERTEKIYLDFGSCIRSEKGTFPFNHKTE